MTKNNWKKIFYEMNRISWNILCRDWRLAAKIVSHFKRVPLLYELRLFQTNCAGAGAICRVSVFSRSVYI